MARFNKTLIVEQNSAYANQIVSTLQDMLDEVEICYDGETGLQLARQMKPDLLFVEAILPQIDGLAILEQILSEDMVRIILTSINQDIIVKKAFELKANYIFVKPYKNDFFYTRMKEIADFHQNREEQFEFFLEDSSYLRVQISRILKELGVSPNVKGYAYLREALTIVYHNFSALDAIRDNIYQKVARQFNTSASLVERNMRTAIEASVRRADEEIYSKCFGYSISSEKGKPTNGQFLAAVADNLLLNKTKKRG